MHVHHELEAERLELASQICFSGSDGSDPQKFLAFDGVMCSASRQNLADNLTSHPTADSCLFGSCRKQSRLAQ